MRHILVDHAGRHWPASAAATPPRCRSTASTCPIRGWPRTVPRAARGRSNGSPPTDPRKARIVELRHFGGLTLEEAAGILGVSVATAHREQRFAEAWLSKALSA